MSERNSAVSASPHTSCFKTLSDSLKIFSRSKQIFLFIYTFLTLPFSFLLFSLSFSSFPIKAHVLHFEYLAFLSPTRFEALQILTNSRHSARSLLHLKLLYFFPTYLLSLLAAVSAVISTHHAHHRRPPISIKTAFSSLRPIWVRPVITSICIHALLFLYSTVPPVLTSMVGTTNLGIWVLARVIGSGVEVYIVAVMGLSLVVSILEERSGWDAIRVGSSLMERRRVCGFVLSGLLMVLTGGIGWRMEEIMMGMIDGEDVGKEGFGKNWTAVMVFDGWERIGLVGVYGLVVLWGFTLNTVFYCECRKGLVIREELEEEEEEMEVRIDNNS